MNSNELFDKLEITNEKYNDLLKLIEIENEKSIALKEILKSSLSFKTFDVINILAQLISIKENEEYKILVCNEAANFKGYRTIGIAITKFFDGNRKIRRFINQLKTSNNLTDYIVIYYNPICKCESSLQKLETITFESLLNEYDLFNTHKIDTSIKCMNSFYNYSYVNEFLSTLFNLQVQRNGEHLSYEEMQKALDDFLNKEKFNQNKRLKKKR